MSAKHTPGPWRYVGFGGTHTLDQNGRCIADAPQPHGMDPEEGFANAHLIASAPELLEALETIARGSTMDVGSNGLGVVSFDYETAKEIARAAIAKAKGKA